jgi:hypothetical protein
MFSSKYRSVRFVLFYVTMMAQHLDVWIPAKLCESRCQPVDDDVSYSYNKQRRMRDREEEKL